MKYLKKIIVCFIICFFISAIYIFQKSTSPTVSNITISCANETQEQTSLIEEEIEHNLINLITLDTNLSFDLRYATTNNFAGKQFYPKIARPYLREETAQKLMKANEEFYTMGYRIKVLDAYRPKRYQYDLREAAKQINPATQGYIANPDTGSHHNRGASVDITLTDLEGHELDMPTAYDHFGPEAHITYDNCTEKQKANRELLGTIMEKHGFRRISSEWWHFDDTDYLNYDLLDIDFADLKE